MASAPSPLELFRIEDTEQSIPARFEQQVERHPAGIALAAGETVWTFAELNASANGVAHALLPHRRMGGEMVALLGDQGPANVVATLGVLKAGMAYLPLDPRDSLDRLTLVMEHSGATRLVVVDDRYRGLAASLASADRRIDLADTSATDAFERVEIAPDDYAYMFYTSGSTGRPKGVADTHRNVLHNVRRYTNNLRITSRDRLTLLQAPHFSGAVSSQFAALLNGARCCPLNTREVTPGRLATYVLREGITIYHSVPALFRLFLAPGRRFPDVRIIRLEGDQASRRDVELYRQHFGDDCLLVNGLGATETGISLQYFVIKDTPLPDGHLPVGFATPDMEVMILDEAGAPLEGVATGEIGVRSRFLAPGYWREPELTARAFVEGPAGGAGRRTYRSGDLGYRRPDGSIEHRGRLDSRVKIRGYTVDLADVEAALIGVPGIREAAVVVRADRRGDQELVAYAVSDQEPRPTLAAIQRVLGDALPVHMRPTAVHWLDALPLSVNGKLDRRQLAERTPIAPPIERPYVPPRTSTEAQLLMSWREVLDVEKVSVTDDFFELGGTSLKAAALSQRVGELFAREVSPSILQEVRTVEGMAALLDRDAQPLRRTLIEIQRGGDRPPLYGVHGHIGEVLFYLPLAKRLGPDQPFYGLSSAGLDADGPVRPTIETMAAAYVRAMRERQPAGPYRLVGYCLGGAIAFEMARQLDAIGERTVVALVDADCPRPEVRSHAEGRLQLHLTALASKGWGDKVRYLSGRVLPAAFVIGSAAWARVLRLRRAVGRRAGWSVSQRLRNQSQMNRDALSRYTPGPYGGPIVHFMSDAPLPPPDPRAGWERLAGGGVETIRVRGELETLMQESGVADLAARLAEWIHAIG